LRSHQPRSHLRPYSKLPGLGSAMTTGDMRGKIDALKVEARGNLGLPNADKVLNPYRGTSLIGNSAPLGPYRR